METAKEIRRLKDWKGNARLFQLSKPLEGFSFVIVSAAITRDQGPETFIFGCNKEDPGKHDEDVDWGELTGSFRGGLNISEALKSAGYEMIP